MAFTEQDSLRARGDFPALAPRRSGPELAFLDGPGGSQVPRVVAGEYLGVGKCIAPLFHPGDRECYRRRIA